MDICRLIILHPLIHNIYNQFYSLNFRYQAEVNRSMGVYRQKYEDWFNGLSEAERKAETSRMNSGKSTRARNNAAAAAAAAQGNI